MDSYYESESDHSEFNDVDFTALDDLVDVDEKDIIPEEKKQENLFSKRLADWAVSNGN